MGKMLTGQLPCPVTVLVNVSVMYRKSYCTDPGCGIGGGNDVGIGIRGGVGISKMLKFYIQVFVSDGQVPVRQAILYADRLFLSHL